MREYAWFAVLALTWALVGFALVLVGSIKDSTDVVTVGAAAVGVGVVLALLNLGDR